jgi:hypothetical protein
LIGCTRTAQLPAPRPNSDALADMRTLQVIHKAKLTRVRTSSLAPNNDSGIALRRGGLASEKRFQLSALSTDRGIYISILGAAPPPRRHTVSPRFSLCDSGLSSSGRTEVTTCCGLPRPARSGFDHQAAVVAVVIWAEDCWPRVSNDKGVIGPLGYLVRNAVPSSVV